MTDLTTLMGEYGSCVMVNGMKQRRPITSREDMDLVAFIDDKTDPLVRDMIASVCPMDEEWKARLQDRWWARAERDSNIDPLLYDLRDRLLTFGGESVCMAFGEPDVNHIMQYGQLWTGFRAQKRRGRQCQCHQNCMDLVFEMKGKYRFCTGYALSEDGMWRQHSWCIERRSRSLKIIETTEPRILYFGYVLDEPELKMFRKRM